MTLLASSERLTDHLLDLACDRSVALPDPGLRMARRSLFDWMTCGLAATGEPVSRLLRDAATEEAAMPVASVIGGGLTSPRMAALINGATSHALDYDDTHFAHIGHLSVGIYPAALAIAELVGASVGQLVEAFLLGSEVAIRVGLALGPAHYDRGFHQTATAGAFGATVAAVHLLGLSRETTREAIGLIATRASGIKNQFGSTGKPLNAGLAASNGVECALWARAGLTSARDGIEGRNGFLATHSDQPAPQAGVRQDFLFDSVKYKLHACCHGTHAMIEALLTMAARPAAGDIAAIRLRTSPRWLTVCDLKTPRTGLEIKFSYVWLAAMVLSGISTAREDSYSESMATDPQLATLAGRISVTGDSALTEMQAEGEITLRDGRALSFQHDLDTPSAPEVLERGLRSKAAALLGLDMAHRLWRATMEREGVRAADLGAILRAR